MSAFSETWRDDFFAALSFLTRLPLRRAADREIGEDGVLVAPSLATVSWAFPLVGTVVGIIGGIAYLVAAGLGLPRLASSLIAIGATVLTTGALHEDGLADTADGLGGGATREDKLAIMRDSRTGAYGALALVFSVALRAAALGQVAPGWRVVGALIAAHALARSALPAALRWLEPARSDGLGAEAGRPEVRLVAWSCGIALVIALLATGLRSGLSATVAAAFVAAAIAWLAQRQIGGQTGDVLGAIEQGAEVAALLAIAAWSP